MKNNKDFVVDDDMDAPVCPKRMSGSKGLANLLKYLVELQTYQKQTNGFNPLKES